jgi:hypothetical protein
MRTSGSLPHADIWLASTCGHLAWRPTCGTCGFLARADPTCGHLAPQVAIRSCRHLARAPDVRTPGAGARCADIRLAPTARADRHADIWLTLVTFAFVHRWSTQTSPGAALELRADLRHPQPSGQPRTSTRDVAGADIWLAIGSPLCRTLARPTARADRPAHIWLALPLARYEMRTSRSLTHGAPGALTRLGEVGTTRRTRPKARSPKFGRVAEERENATTLLGPWGSSSGA